MADLTSLRNTTQDAIDEKMAFANDLMSTFAEGRTDLIGGGFDLPVATRLIRLNTHGADGFELLPTIVLPVNPKTFKVTYKKKSNYQYTLGGFVLNHWHDDLTTIQASGYIPSMSSRSKPFALSYWYFLRFLNLYKQCGQVTAYQKSYVQTANPAGELGQSVPPESATDISETQLDPVTRVDENGNIQANHQDSILVDRKKIQSAEINLAYQAENHIGIFTDFTIDESEEYPNTLQYTFNFLARESGDTMGGHFLGGMAQSAFFGR